MRLALASLPIQYRPRAMPRFVRFACANHLAVRGLKIEHIFSGLCLLALVEGVVRRVFLDGLDAGRARPFDLITLDGKYGLPVAGFQPESKLTRFICIALNSSGHEHAPLEPY